LLPKNTLNVDHLQWWLIAEDSIPETGIRVTGLTEDKNPFIMSREIILNNHNLKNMIQLKKIFNSFTFITPSCYLSKKIPGFIIMGPLPANCPLPMSPCIMRIPLTRKISFIIFTYLLNFQMNILIYLFFLSYEKENKSRLKFEAVKVLFTLETSFHRYL